MKNMTIWNIARACMGRLVIPAGRRGTGCPAAGMAVIRGYSGKEAARIVIDSRLVEPGDVFVAVRGERVDGHRFIPEVFEKGAIAVVCEKEPEPLTGPCIRVEDSLAALRKIAAFYREQLPIPIVGITGSVGKTSTKEFVAAVLSQKYKTHKTKGNFNNEVGVPLTLLSMPEDTEAAVVEMGINHFGEMRRLSEMVRPDICLLTNIGQCHLEFLGSRDGILRAKSEIFEFMNPEGSVCVNGDDDKLATIREVCGKAPVRFGLSPDNDIYADQIVSRGLLGSEAVIHVGKNALRGGNAQERAFAVKIPLPGTHMVQNALAAAAAGLLLGLTDEEIAAGIASAVAVGGRSRVIRTGRLTVIDDCYNANPVSTKAALDLLGLAEGRKVAVLGDMFELGEQERTLHAQVGAYAAERGIDCLFCAGELSEETARAAREAGVCQARHFADTQALLEALPELLRDGDSVLVKASHGMGFDRIVKKLEEN
ncbi:MAG: UDP-N-acetylmuramoyl-tripeptide--D-alanyl-D-alanine ligase [Eubacteriales bacterium]|nr:UDP-N-acetylmuramoyl-tripeptide--D-alanyl-D-alanine ligase [Eubacteriales bacterium]